MDGGLERLIHILRTPPQRVPSHARDAPLQKGLQANWKWSLAFQCVVNIGVRGSEKIRTRVVEAGIAPVIVRVLESFLLAAEAVKEDRLWHDTSLSAAPHAMQRAVYPSLGLSDTPHPLEERSAAPPGAPSDAQRDVSVYDDSTQDAEMPSRNACYWTDHEASVLRESSTSRRVLSSEYDASASGSASECAEDAEMCVDDGDLDAVAVAPSNDVVRSSQETPRPPRPSLETPLSEATPRPQRTQTPTPGRSTARLTLPQIEANFVYREEEVLMSLQLLAYLSKYPHVRLFFHNADVRDTMLFCPDWPDEGLPNRTWSPSDPLHRNVFSVAERFTTRSSRMTGCTGALNSFFPRLGHEIQYWAGVVMRNACRKDESRGGIRQCANMLCGKWEAYPREFAKCRRCRKAKYCSKQCQSKGWQMGHRFWCSARDDVDRKKDDSRASFLAPETDSGAATPPAGPVPQSMETQETVTAALLAARAEPADADAPAHPRPFGTRAMPSTLSRTVPQMRGASAASVETTDFDMSDENAHVAVPVHTTPSPNVREPMIAGALSVHGTDTPDSVQEAQGMQGPGILEAIAATWSGTDVNPTPAPGPSTEHYDLRIRVPSSLSAGSASPGTPASPDMAQAPRLTPLGGLTIAQHFRARYRIPAGRTVSSSMLSNSFSAADLAQPEADMLVAPRRMSATTANSRVASPTRGIATFPGGAQCTDDTEMEHLASSPSG
ncbi:hypothetical protein MVES1_001370 [Malassezia vespertilionis]|nr:uncharacterized protein MVES1_001370 [Malassezia vespertilionis]WFD06032.1 hypothetical protein MVES1_001370 [Malassezia vespertilionis]